VRDRQASFRFLALGYGSAKCGLNPNSRNDCITNPGGNGSFRRPRKKLPRPTPAPRTMKRRFGSPRPKAKVVSRISARKSRAINPTNPPPTFRWSSTIPEQLGSNLSWPITLFLSFISQMPSAVCSNASSERGCSQADQSVPLLEYNSTCRILPRRRLLSGDLTLRQSRIHAGPRETICVGSVFCSECASDAAVPIEESVESFECFRLCSNANSLPIVCLDLCCGIGLSGFCAMFT